MAKCFICGCELDENTKPEHIIPNGIGGKLKSKEILCNKHNNELYELDQIICKDLETHTNRLNPSRDNGKNPSTTYELPTGQKVIMQPNGEYYAEKPAVQVNELEDGKIQIQYSTYYSNGSQHKEFALNQLKSITKGICEKQGIAEEKIKSVLNNIDETFEKNIKTDFNPILKIQFQFNSSGKLFLGISKIALDFYFYNKLSKNHVEKFLNKFIEQDITFINNNANYYYDDNLFSTDSIYHTLILKGDKINELLYCIVSLYGVLNCIVFLNRNYMGENFIKTYSYDLRNKEVVNFDKTPEINQDIAKDLLNRRGMFEELKTAQNIFMSFFKYGNNKELHEDFENFANKLQDEIKVLQSQPIINNSDEFQKVFEEIFNKHAIENKTLKQLTKYELAGLSKTIQQSITYDFYLQPYVLHITNRIIVDAITDILLNNSELLNNDESLINKVFEFYISAKTNNETLNKLLQSNKEKVKEHIKDFIPKIKTQLIHYHSCLNK